MPRNSKNSDNAYDDYTGDCSVIGVMKKAYEIAKKSNVKNPSKTGNSAVDYVVGGQPHISAWNKGFTVGKIGFIAQQTYKETCKRKK